MSATGNPAAFLDLPVSMYVDVLVNVSFYMCLVLMSGWVLGVYFRLCVSKESSRKKVSNLCFGPQVVPAPNFTVSWVKEIVGAALRRRM